MCAWRDDAQWRSLALSSLAWTVGGSTGCRLGGVSLCVRVFANRSAELNFTLTGPVFNSTLTGRRAGIGGIQPMI